MKRYLKPILTGIVVILIIILVMLKITMNFQVHLFLGATLFFISGVFNSKNQNHFLITTTSIVIFYLSFFILMVLSELPELWYFVPIYIASTLLGLFFKKYHIRIGILSLLLALAMFYLAIEIIPENLKDSLTKERYDKLPEFSLQDVNGKLIDSKSFKGKVVVIDFFGTWCKPCLQELKELEKIKANFSEKNVVFYVINADYGGDTPDKFKKFIENTNYTFNYAYDHESKVFKQLDMYQFGLPALLIIDKDQNIRFQHVGYNTAETNFKENMIETINSLK